MEDAQRMTKLDEAKNFLEEALREFEKGVKENNTTLVRDAGEKALGGRCSGYERPL